VPTPTPSSGTRIGDSLKATFGAGATTVHQTKTGIEHSPPLLNMVITVQTGVKTTATMSPPLGDLSKPISVFAQGRTDNYAFSSVGAKINAERSSLNLNLGLDDISIRRSSSKSGNTMSSLGLVADISKQKIGLEYSTTTILSNNTTKTEYTNVSVSGGAIIAVVYFFKTGQWNAPPVMLPAR
jgi:hypothetical protein